MGRPQALPGRHCRSYASCLCVWGGLVMMGASGVGRSLGLSAGVSTSYDGPSSWPSGSSPSSLWTGLLGSGVLDVGPAVPLAGGPVGGNVTI